MCPPLLVANIERKLVRVNFEFGALRWNCAERKERMSLKGVAKETLHILKEGKYITDSGNNVEFLSEQRNAVIGTKLYKPEQGYELLA
ncbi:MAG: hypothetical protein FD167_4527, partial [bacterium]